MKEVFSADGLGWLVGFKLNNLYRSFASSTTNTLTLLTGDGINSSLFERTR